MSSVENMFGLFEKLQSRDVIVHEDRCLHVRNRNARCSKCADACTSNCLSISGNQLTVNPENCIGCSTCCTVCPTGALEAGHPNDLELLKEIAAAMMQAEGKAIIASVKIVEAAKGQVDPAKVVSVANVGRIDESTIVALARMGAKEIVLVVPPDSDAADLKGMETAQLVVETANALLELWGFEGRARISRTFPGIARLRDAGFDPHRRNFFRDLRDEAKDVADTSINYVAVHALRDEEAPTEHVIKKVGKDGTLAKFVPGRRKRLLKMLADKGVPEDEMIGTRLWGHVIIDPDTCVGCRMCATFCPTGALQKYKDEDGETGIEHAPSRCVKCRCCQDVCPKCAITISDEVFAQDLICGGVERFPMCDESEWRSGSHNQVRAMRKIYSKEWPIYER